MARENARSRTYHLKVWGENACFTRPEMKVERVSYDMMTPSAARGILEAILWKPAIRWIVTEIDVLNPIQWESVRRNEVGVIMSPGGSGMYVEDERQQRAGLLLKNVAYTIHAFFERTHAAAENEGIVKFQEMFERRSSKGQCFNQPYLGCREFPAYFEPLSPDAELPPPIDLTANLGWMLRDMVFRDEENPMPTFFNATIEKGRVHIPLPEREEVRG